MFGLEAKAIVLGLVGLAFLALLALVHHYRSEYQVEHAQFESYKQLIEARGKQAEAEKLLQEQKDAQRIASAVSSRDDALGRLRIAQANARSRTVSSNPTAPTGSSQVCFRSDAYNAAFSNFGAGLNQFLQAASGFAFEGDSANLDAKALIQAWPSK
jgi:hypothetical protein